ncbi:MAG TPA: hypothetical protein VK666_20055, partial [Chryseolinea sp.]|nr:hypothetical protein [Chryseolinea sp.]
WMLPIFREQGERNSRNKKYQFWRQSLSRVHCGNNRPEELYSPRFITQKINYIHNNPVVAGIVEKPEHYLNSSARDYLYGKKCGVLDIIFL